MALGLASLLVACGTPPKDEAKGNLVLTDAHNYQSMSALSIPVIETKPEADIEICWDKVTKDIQCHDVDPMLDLKTAGLTRFPGKTPDQVQALLGQTLISTNQYDVYRELRTNGGMCGQLATMDFLGGQINLTTDYNEAPDKTYLMMVTDSELPGIGTRSMVFVKPVSTSDNTHVDIPNGCAPGDPMSPQLTFNATLSPTSLSAAGLEDLVLDWSQVTTDSTGADIRSLIVDSVLIGFYPNLAPADVQAQVIDLEYISTEIWEAPIAEGTTVDLKTASKRGTGEPFLGFDRTDGTWIVALRCSKCQNPAPVVLTVVTP
jgi:hypothetical protein